MPDMAKIVASEKAPEGKVRFSLGNAEIEKLPFTTDDPVVLANADAHPWLDVEYEVVEELADQADPFPQVRPEDDALAAENSIANDPKAVRAALAERKGDSDPVALDAGLDQGDVEVTASGIAETIAADKADDKKVDAAQRAAQKEIA